MQVGGVLRVCRIPVRLASASRLESTHNDDHVSGGSPQAVWRRAGKFAARAKSRRRPRRGRPPKEEYIMVAGILLVLSKGIQSRDLPEHLGPWGSVRYRAAHMKQAKIRSPSHVHFSRDCITQPRREHPEHVTASRTVGRRGPGSLVRRSRSATRSRSPRVSSEQVPSSRC